MLTVFAAGFLALDGILLVLAGVWSHRPALLVWGVIFFLATGAVVAYWRYHVRRMAALQLEVDARAVELRRMAEELRKEP